MWLIYINEGLYQVANSQEMALSLAKFRKSQDKTRVIKIVSPQGLEEVL